MRAYALLVFLFISQAFAAEKPIDYSTLDFTLTLTALRAGNHDESGTNSYFFQTKLYGLPIRKEDIKKPFADRPKSGRPHKASQDIKQDILEIASLATVQLALLPS
ncbi:MAG: hypothetical protein EOP10_23170 [Proteobacteria bacterium]|nr:MAG: hypothetical protein EOP10_23170 [Pseudomonadota bacterium]